jgi:hypothetical protein
LEHATQSHDKQSNATLPTALFYFLMQNPERDDDNSRLQITSSTRPPTWRSGKERRRQEQHEETSDNPKQNTPVYLW